MTSLLSLCERYVQISHQLVDLNDTIARENELRRDENERKAAAARIGVAWIGEDRPYIVGDLLIKRNELERQLSAVEQAIKDCFR